MPKAFQEITEDDVKNFIICLGMSDLNPDDERYLSQTMQKCFPQHSCIYFDTAGPDERWNK